MICLRTCLIRHVFCMYLHVLLSNKKYTPIRNTLTKKKSNVHNMVIRIVHGSAPPSLALALFNLLLETSMHF